MADSERKLQQLQMLEQSISTLSMQKQQFQMQQLELENAMKELESVKEAYKIVGNIMVLTKKEDLLKDLSTKKETVGLRIKTLEKQENQFKEKAQTLQNDVLKEMSKDDGSS